MDNVNKIISFVLGLIVVIVVLLLITGRLGLFKGGKLFTVSRGSTSTSPTPTPTPQKTAKTTVTGKVSPTPKRLAYNDQPNTTPDPKNLSTIPSTGSSTELLALSFVGVVAGLFLKKAKIS